ncbi:MAG: Rrf2 family transcriptional regulator [Myxococcota bacterium]|nr:Rrf2 family transcriptional regulator [Myxococcota bacterium]
MRFSLQARYAICGVFDLAYNGHGEAVQVRVIGERQGIPTRYLEQIFQRLRRAGLIVGKRGPGGGYSLLRTPAELDLRSVVEAVEGPLAPFAPFARDGAADEVEEAGAAASANGPDFLWDELGDRLGEVLAEVTVEDLCRRAARDAVPRTAVEGYEYQI